MKQYEAQSFSLPTIEGISEKQFEVHIGLYKGYVNSLNAIYEKMASVPKDDAHTLSSLQRRIGFELAGIQNHEQYFGALEGGAQMCTRDNCLFHEMANEQYGSFDGFVEAIKHTAKTMRGVGWVIVTFDAKRKALHIMWVSDHELGNVNLPAVFAMDMWEHSYMVDYVPADKMKYVEAYVGAINWEYVGNRVAAFAE